MSDPSQLPDVLQRVLDGDASPENLDALRQAFLTGRLVLAEGPRSVVLGGDANQAVIVTGDNNLLLRFEGDQAASVRALRDRLLPDRPFQLPSDLPDFVGRRKDVDALLAVFRSGQGRVAISALGGMGGIGKTALAVHVAHLLMADFPAGQLVVDLRGTEPEPLTPADFDRAAAAAVWDASEAWALRTRSWGSPGRALELAEGALEIYQQIESPAAAEVRSALEEWRGERT